MHTNDSSSENAREALAQWRWRRAALAALLVVVAAAAVVFVALHGDDLDGGAARSAKPASPGLLGSSAAEPGESDGVTTVADAAGGPANGPSTDGGNPGGEPPTPLAPPPNSYTGPEVITYTASTTSITCSTQSPVLQPVSVTLGWETRNAVAVDLSIDGGGLYDSYGPQGKATVNVPCDGNDHTYTVVARAADGATSIPLTMTVTTAKV